MHAADQQSALAAPGVLAAAGPWYCWSPVLLGLLLQAPVVGSGAAAAGPWCCWFLVLLGLLLLVPGGGGAAAAAAAAAAPQCCSGLGPEVGVPPLCLPPGPVPALSSPNLAAELLLPPPPPPCGHQARQTQQRQQRQGAGTRPPPPQQHARSRLRS
eukprot:CAMPEP_0202396012 /NCGR_PEP_ID=MMETSP1127-20130417/94274_1 /ASSEMBLY_ACC=CAM_ASM_000462 /TAXON_ID=3047 /ORGANISM="Dunaliella tertiolecta, Strain CCMP1320" /LENGTH=155 /DNA_ID=CAMNT_0048998749 /DNA_START=1019 /DNA_END=1486 /DNA_ORIENTATION=-